MLTHTCTVGSDGCTANWSTSATAFQGTYRKLWTNYRTRSMGHMNALCEKSKTQTGSLPDGCSSALRWLPGHSVSRSWQNFSHLISRRDLFRNIVKIGASTIPWKQCCLRARHCLPLSLSTTPQLYNFRTSQ